MSTQCFCEFMGRIQQISSRKKRGLVELSTTTTRHDCHHPMLERVLMGCNHLQARNQEQIRKFRKRCNGFLDTCRLFNREELNLRKIQPLIGACKTMEDDLTALQNMMQGGTARNVQDRAVTQPTQQVQELRQNSLWHQMQVTEVHQIKEKFLPVVKDVENRLVNLENTPETPITEEQSGS